MMTIPSTLSSATYPANRRSGILSGVAALLLGISVPTSNSLINISHF
ncbi:MAG: hypothetical protein ACRCUG_10620 [Yersinia sp. (in: enterobacteria)]